MDLQDEEPKKRKKFYAGSTYRWEKKKSKWVKCLLFWNNRKPKSNKWIISVQMLKVSHLLSGSLDHGKKKNQAKICLLAKMLHSNSWTVGEWGTKGAIASAHPVNDISFKCNASGGSFSYGKEKKSSGSWPIKRNFPKQGRDQQKKKGPLSLRLSRILNYIHQMGNIHKLVAYSDSNSCGRNF